MTSSPSTSETEQSVPESRTLTWPARILLATLSGFFYFGGYIGFGQFYLIWICFVPALFAVRGLNLWKTFWVGLLFGTVTNLGGFYWVVQLIHDFAFLAWPLAGLGYFLLCFYQGGICASILWLVRRADRDLGVAPVWGLAVAMPAIELVYPLLFPNFIGYSQYRFLLITQICDVTGVAGLSVVIMLVNGAVYELISARVDRRPWARSRVLVPAAAFAASLLYGAIRIPMVESTQAKARTIQVGLVQTNLGARDKQELASEFIQRHIDMSEDLVREHPDLDLLVWPESAYNRYVAREAGDVSGILGPGIDRPVIFGALTQDFVVEHGERRRRAYNTVLLANARGKVIGMYDKIELLAFGETIPLVDRFPWLRKYVRLPGTFERGRSLDHLKLENGISLLPMICYEDIIPSIPRRLWDASGPANILVNVTNDSWYGDSHEPLIHLAMSTFRSIETRRALIRSTNTGISGFVDLTGRIYARTGQWTRESLVRAVPVIEDGSTTIYTVIGDLIGWIVWGFVVTGFVLARRRRSASKAAAEEPTSTSADKKSKKKKGSGSRPRKR